MQNVVIRSIERLDFRTKEAYKTLRTNLSFAGKNVKVISLTSCMPNEGKTSVSFQLCLSLAESGKKTILVDADLRKSVLRGCYKANRERYGLSHYLSGQMELDDVCCRTNVNNFDIIFAGPIPPNPSELLGGDAFKNMLEVLRMKYDYVIVDTPPLGSVIDGAVVGAICDGTVLVVESGAISYKICPERKRTAGQGRLPDSWMCPEQGQHQKESLLWKILWLLLWQLLRLRTGWRRRSTGRAVAGYRLQNRCDSF